MRRLKEILQSRWVALLLCVVPLGLYALFFQRIALNLNFIAYDDLHVLQIVEQWQRAANWRGRFDWLTVGFPEHRIVFSRTVVLVSYWLTGQVNFKYLMIFSNLLWVSQLAILYQVFRPLRLSLWYFVPVCWLVLNVHAFENIFWGTSSLGNFGTLFFVLLAAYGYTHLRGRGLTVAWVSSCIATFCYGNGLMAFLTGLAVLVLVRRWRAFFGTLGVFLVVLGIYSFTRANATPATLDLTDPAKYWLAVQCFFGFLGSSFSMNPYDPRLVEQYLSVGWGIVLFSGVVWSLRAVWLPLLRFRWPRAGTLSPTQQFLLVVLLFLSLTAVGVIYKRAQWDYLVGMFKGRYRMYPTWMMMVAYFSWLLVIVQKKQKKGLVLGLIIGVSIALNLLILYHSIAPAVNNRRTAVAQEFTTLHNPDLIGLKMFDMTHAEYLRLRELYQPKLFTDALALPVVKDTSIKTEGTIYLDSVWFDRESCQIRYGQDFIRPTYDTDDGAYVILKSPTHTYMSAGLQGSLPFKTFVRRGWYWDRGFMASFNRYATVPGTYRLYVLLRQGGQNHLLDAQRTLNFEEPPPLQIVH